MGKQPLKVPILRDSCGTVLGWRIHRGNGERACLICKKAQATNLHDNPPDPPQLSELLPKSSVPMPPMPTFICPYPDCNTVSYDPAAARGELYCGTCHRFAADRKDEEEIAPDPVP
jgi:hypothetical protein